MSTATKSSVVVAGSSVVSREGAAVKVQRIDLTKVGASLLTSNVAHGIGEVVNVNVSTELPKAGSSGSRAPAPLRKR